MSDSAEVWSLVERLMSGIQGAIRRVDELAPGFPEELYEVAEVNGASSRRQLFSITLPLLKPVALFILVINSIKSFQVFVEIFVMTKGKFDTSTMVYFIYDTGLATAFNFGYASAAAYILFIIIAVFSALQFILFRKKETAW